MKKLLLAVPLLLGASWAGSAYFTGTKAQQAYNALLVELNTNKGLVWKNESYAAGVAKSTAITRVTLSTVPEEDISFLLQHDIEHSPVGLSNGKPRFSAAKVITTVLDDDTRSEEFQRIMAGFGSEKPLLMSTEVAFDGSNTSQLYVGAYHIEDKEMSFTSGGLEQTLDVKGDIYTSSGQIKPIEFKGDDATVQLSPGNIELDVRRIISGVYAGSSAVTFKELSIESNQAPPMLLETLGITYENDVDNDVVDSRLEYFVENIDAPIPVDSASLAVNVKGISVAKWKAFSDISNQMSQSNPEELKHFASAALELLEPNASLDMTVELTNEGGDMDTDLSINVVDASSPHYPANGLSTLKTLRELLQLLSLELTVEADVAAINVTPAAAFMQSPMIQQFVVSDEESHTMNVTVADLVVDINGNAATLEQMLPINLDMPLETLLGK